MSVAVSGDIAVVGAPSDPWDMIIGWLAGAAYVFQRDQGGTDNWGEVKKLTASDAEAYDWFGMSVAVSGDTAVVGAPWEDAGGENAGAAYVFQQDQGGPDNRGETQKLTASDAQVGDEFGTSAAVSADTALAGAPQEGVGGATYVFGPLPVGGIQELPEIAGAPPEAGGSSGLPAGQAGPGAGVLAGIAAGVAAVVLVVGGGVWYVRRRRV